MHTRPKSQVILPLLLSVLFFSGVMTATSSVFAAAEDDAQPQPKSQDDAKSDGDAPDDTAKSDGDAPDDTAKPDGDTSHDTAKPDGDASHDTAKSDGDASHGDAKSDGDASHGDASHDDASHDTSVPLEPKVDLVLISIISFGLFLIVLRKVAWGPLIAGLDGRESSYRKLLADAQQDRDKAIAILGDYETKLKAAQAEVDEIIAEARRDAERTKTDIIAAAQTEAETTRNRALDDIGRARDQAVAELFDHMRSNVVAATEQVLSRSLNDEDHQRLVDEALAQVSGS